MMALGAGLHARKAKLEIDGEHWEMQKDTQKAHGLIFEGDCGGITITEQEFRAWGNGGPDLACA